MRRPTTGAWAAASHLASRSPLATVAGGWALAHGLMMWLCLLAQVPFPAAVLDFSLNGFALTDWHGWAAAGAGAGAISGLAIGLALLRTAALREQVQILLVAIPWLFASAIAWVGPFYLSTSYLSLGYQSLDGVQWEIYQLLHNLETLLGSFSLPAFVAAGAVTGIIGGCLTGLLVRRWDPALQLSDVLTIAVGWGAAWALAWLLPGQFFHSDELRNLPAVTYQAPWIELLPAVMFVAGAIAGLIGGRIMLWQVARTHQRENAD